MPSSGAEWLIERGIGEDRALLVDDEQIVAARHFIHGEPTVGTTYPAQLVSKSTGSLRGTALTAAGFEVLVDNLPPACTEGSKLDIVLTRAPIPERGRTKLAQGRIAAYGEQGEPWSARQVPSFEPGLWEEVWHAASSGKIQFAGGEILCCTTPAMTLIDIDGSLPARELALAAIPAITRALRWFDTGGSVGIDFPTLDTKADRRAVDHALADALADWPHERTAMNGFGFVQLVARLERPSLLHRFEAARLGMCVRNTLRLAERTKGTGAILLTIHPALKARLKDEWLSELARRTGREIRIATDPGLALEAGFAQAVPL